MSEHGPKSAAVEGFASDAEFALDAGQAEPLQDPVAVSYRVSILEDLYCVPVLFPTPPGRRELEAGRRFAASTAWLCHTGWLPEGTVNTMD